MARVSYVWGIDIGKCALKALRCRPGVEPRTLVVEQCEYIEYPMMLTQAEADPVEIVRAALEELTTKHDLRGDVVAVAVPGHLGLSKFIKLPPIEARKIPDIVKYEAKQQIPFPLEQVVWRWQRLAGGMEESGFVLDAEVALFAMKREQVYKALAPLTEGGVRVDVLQLAPIALANMAIFDQLPDPATIDPDSPPASIVLVAMGVESTDLVVTNGLRIWQRSIPIGGSSFTKALVQGMKLTFNRAESLKRNATKAEDPKAVFKTMRPVFNSFAAELQRSLNYFTGTDKTATIGKVFLLGNATKLRGLSDFVGQQLQLDVQRLDTFAHLEGSLVSSPVFKENHLAYGTAYGLALQAADKTALATNLLPDEIVLDRIIEAKKPWAVAALMGLLAAALLDFFGMFAAWTAYSKDIYADAFQAAEDVKKRSAAATGAINSVMERQKAAIDQQQWLAKVQDRRFQMLDMLRAVESLMPRDEGEKAPENPAERNELHIDKVDCQFFPDLATWFTGVSQQWAETHSKEDAAEEGEAAKEAAEGQPAAEAAGGDAPAAADGVAADPADPAAADPSKDDPLASKGPTGAGWVIEMRGYHFHNEPQHKPYEGAQFVRSTIVKNLLGKGAKVVVSAGPKAGDEVPVSELGLGYPVIIYSSPIRTVRLATGKAGDAGGPGGGGGAAAPPASGPGAPGSGGLADEPQELVLRRHDFLIQFVWQPERPDPAAAPAAE